MKTFRSRLLFGGLMALVAGGLALSGCQNAATDNGNVAANRSSADSKTTASYGGADQQSADNAADQTNLVLVSLDVPNMT